MPKSKTNINGEDGPYLRKSKKKKIVGRKKIANLPRRKIGTKSPPIKSCGVGHATIANISQER
jgi:hypothetical protein